MENKELKENNIDNKYGIEYTKVGDYYMPNLVLEKEEKITLNKYGRLRLKFLKENKKAEYIIMFMNKTLRKHIVETDKQAKRKFEILMKQMLQKNPIDEHLKDTDPLKWTGIMNNYKCSAEEIIFKELIYI